MLVQFVQIICTCVWSELSAEYYETTGIVAYVWSAEQGNMSISLSPFVPENLVSGDEFGRPVPRQPAHSPLHSGWPRAG